MREIVIVIPDLYLDPSAADPRASAPEVPPGTPGAMPGFEHIARYAARRSLAADGGWRPWLARWLGRPDLASYAPAPIAAASLRASTDDASASAAPPPNASVHSGPPTTPGARPPAPAHADAMATRSVRPNVPARTGLTATPDAPANVPTPAASHATQTVWLATPVHLIAGLTNLHFDRRGILRLSGEELVGFAEDFNRTFGDTDLHLEPLANGEFLLRGPATWSAAVTTEPARALVSGLESSLPKGNAATALRRLGAELEMWLHSHPVNAARERRGQHPVSTLWLWGGGVLESLKSCSAPPTDLAYGTDPYLAGLWQLQSAPARGLPDRFGDVLSDPKTERVALAPEITPLLHTNPNWGVFEALVDLDRLYLSPALTALRSRALERVTLVANDVEIGLRHADRLKLWRRARPGIGALRRS